MTQSIKKPNGLIWLIVAAIAFVIDIISKLAIHYTFNLYDSIQILPFFSITYVRNIGAAFSMFEGQRWALAVIALLVSAFILYTLYKNNRDKKLENSALALILGGALGNLFDRLYHGYVIDFLDVNFGNWHYPTFNIADCSICVGVALYVLSGLLTKKNTEKKS